MSQRPPPPAELVAIVARKTASLGDSEAWAAINVAAVGYGIRNKELTAFRDAVWMARKAAERMARAERLAGKAAAREKSLAAVGRRAEQQRRRHLAAGAAASNAADVLDAFPVEKGTP